MNSNILIFLQRLGLFLLLLVLCDFCLGFVLERIYFNQSKGQFAQTTYSIDKTNHDILIFGSSRAVRHYSPKIISKGLQMSCYNVGRDAQMIPYYVAMQEAIYKRHKPKMVILDVNSWELSPGDGKYEKLSILLPYVREHPELIPYVGKSSRWEKIKLLSKTYPYNSTLFILGFNVLFSAQVAADENGYAPLNGEMTNIMLKDHIRRVNISDDASNESLIDAQVLKYYQRFLETNEKLNIKTYVVISPKILRENDTYRVKLLMKIALKFNNVKFLNFSADPNYNFKYQKFADVYHLNKMGSEEFTRDFLTQIKR